MRNRRFKRESNRDRSLSPRRPRNIYPSRNGENSPRRDEYSRDSDRSNRDVYSSRDRRLRDYDGSGVGARRSRSPRRNERRVQFDRDTDVRTIRSSEYDVDIGVGSVRPRRVYDEEDLLYAGSRSQRDQISYRPKRIVVDDSNDYDYKSEYYVSGDYYTSKNGGEREFRVGNGDSDELLPVSRSRQFLPEYVKEGKKLSDPYTWADNVDVGTSKYTSAGLESRSQFSSGATRYLTSDTERQGHIRSQDELQLGKKDRTFLDPGKSYSKKRSDDFDLEDMLKPDKSERMMERNIYKNGNEDHLYYPENPKVPKYSLSQPSNYTSLPPSNYKESPPYFSSRGTHVPHEYDEKLQISPGILGHQSVDIRNSSRSYHGPDEEKHADRFIGTSEIDRFIAKPRHSEEEYTGHLVTGVSDSTVEKSYKRKYPIDDPVWDPYPSSLQQSHSGRGNMKSDERYTVVRSGPLSDEERSDVLRSTDYDISFSKPWASEEASRGEPYGRRPRYKHFVDDSGYTPSVGMKISCDGYGARKIFNPLDDEMDIPMPSKKPKVSEFGYDEAIWIPDEMRNHQRSSEKSTPRHSSSPHKPKARDVKSRLGPLHPKLHVSQRLENVKKPSIKNRLGPTPSEKHGTLPWVKASGSSTTPSIQGDSDSCHDQDEHMMEQLPRPDGHIMEQLPTPEPSEKSLEFKKLVQSAFFKFLKQINETPIKRNQYTEQGKAGGLKCIVCGSNSKEFTNTKGLAMHTFTSEKPGLRSQHLGLHKALCVVNGWKTAELPISAWQCEKVSNAENTAIKEDIIIWPPVVIVHNTSIDNKNPGERIIVSTEELNLKFRGMGFANIIKVCNGKPANQSVMVVKFNPTLSGLQEAERLHKSYVETKQSKPELQPLEYGTNGSTLEGIPVAAETKQAETERQQLESGTKGSSGEGTPPAAETKQTETEFQQSESCANGSSGEGTPAAAANKEKYLDGHLGLAEDLEKLDFGTKRRSGLKSKIEILRIVGAPLGTSGKKASASK